MSTPGIFKRLKKKMGRTKGGYEISNSESPEGPSVILNKFQRAPTSFPDFENSIISRGDLSLRAGSQFGRSLDQFDRARNSNVNGSNVRQERVPIAVPVPVPPPLDNTTIIGKRGFSNSVEDLEDEVASMNLYDSIDNLHSKTLPKGTKFTQPLYSHEEVCKHGQPVQCASPITRSLDGSTEINCPLDNNNFLLEQKKKQKENMEKEKKELPIEVEVELPGYSTLDELQIEIEDKEDSMKSSSDNGETHLSQDTQNHVSFNELGARPKTSTSSSYSDVTSSRGSESPPFPPPPPHLLPVEDEFNMIDHVDHDMSKSVDSFPFSSHSSHLIDRQCSYRSESSMSTSEEYNGGYNGHPSDYDDNHPLNRKVYRETSEHRIEDIGEISSSVEDLYARVPRSNSRSLDLIDNEEDKTISSDGNVGEDIDTIDLLENGNDTGEEVEDEDGFPPPPIPMRNYRGEEEDEEDACSSRAESPEPPPLPPVNYYGVSELCDSSGDNSPAIDLSINEPIHMSLQELWETAQTRGIPLPKPHVLNDSRSSGGSSRSLDSGLVLDPVDERQETISLSSMKTSTLSIEQESIGLGSMKTSNMSIETLDETDEDKEKKAPLKEPPRLKAVTRKREEDQPKKSPVKVKRRSLPDLPRRKSHGTASRENSSEGASRRATFVNVDSSPEHADQPPALPPARQPPATPPVRQPQEVPPDVPAKASTAPKVETSGEGTKGEGGKTQTTNRRASHNTNISSNVDFIDSLMKLKDCGWYWGPLSWDDAEVKLANKPDGSFLVRDSSDDRYILSLSFRSQGTTHHTRIEHYKGTFSFYSQPKSHGEGTIVEFIEKAMEHSRSGKFLYFLRPRAPGFPPAPVQLLFPVSRFRIMQSLQHLCRFVILKYVRYDHIDYLPLPPKIKSYLKESQYYTEYIMDNELGYICPGMHH